MDQNLERDLIKNTANEILRRETDGREKSNKCNQCNSTFSQAAHLRRHLRTHSGEKPNKCNQCDFASIQAGDLRRHLKTHSGEKSNKCSQCDFASYRASGLRIHLKTHSGEKWNKTTPNLQDPNLTYLPDIKIEISQFRNSWMRMIVLSCRDVNWVPGVLIGPVGILIVYEVRTEWILTPEVSE